MIKGENTVGFRRSRKSIKNYFEWRKERAAPAIDMVNSIKNLKDCRVLEIGCGFGSLCNVLADRGARVWATEIDKKKLEIAEKLLINKNVKLIKVKCAYLFHHHRLLHPHKIFILHLFLTLGNDFKRDEFLILVFGISYL